ncbi:MAG: polysaccharide biosynthesis C-terminal domain-containing protein, partial [Candidatus Rokubacteria bacterium]|nr:polysaccharide biosynthesis C-terminal domain-containing protein [Candidatus Rokubacteria bacterium]
QLMGAVQQVPMVSFPVVVPYLVAAHVAGRIDTIDTYLERVVPHAVFGVVALLAAGLVIGPLVVVPVFGAGFAAAARALPVLLFAVGWYCVFIAYIPLLNLRERTRAMLVASLAAAAANVGGNLLLVPRWGVDGAAWAAVASQAAGALAVVAGVRRDYVVRVGGVLVLLAPLAVLLIGQAVEGAPAAIVAGGAAGVLLVVAARWQRLASPADRRLLARLDLPIVRRLLPAPRGTA